VIAHRSPGFRVRAIARCRRAATTALRRGAASRTGSPTTTALDFSVQSLVLQAFVWVADAPDTDQAPSALRPGGRGLTHGTRIAPPSADRCAIRRNRRKRARRRRRIAAAGVRRMRGRRRAVRRPHDAANAMEPERSRPKDGLPFLWRRPADGARAAERGSVAHTKA